MAFSQAPTPKSALGRYRLLSPTAAVRVSPLCLGAMNFGEAWKDYMGSMSQSTTEDILDYFYEQGGNFIDTSSNYQNEESEIWIGEWMKKRGVRDQMVIATKYTTDYRCGRYGKGQSVHANYAGNSTKSMKVSVDASLKKLQTDYIDLLYVHWWDYSASIPELMQSLNQLVLSGKVLYLGISDTPAWVVSKANQYARDHGLRQFCVYQGQWSAASRDFEREIIPMCKDEGMALAPWGSMGGGAFKTEEARKANEGRQQPASEAQINMSKVLEKIANRKKTAITSVALAYVLHKTPYVFPIIGGRTTAHLKGNIEALSLEMTQEDMYEIEDSAPFDLGFPHDFLSGASFGMPTKGLQRTDVWLLKQAGTFDYVKQPAAIGPSPSEPKADE